MVVSYLCHVQLEHGFSENNVDAIQQTKKNIFYTPGLHIWIGRFVIDTI